MKTHALWVHFVLSSMDLTGELWGVYCDKFGGTRPRYNATALYIKNKEPNNTARRTFECGDPIYSDGPCEKSANQIGVQMSK